MSSTAGVNVVMTYLRLYVLYSSTVLFYLYYLHILQENIIQVYTVNMTFDKTTNIYISYFIVYLLYVPNFNV